MRVVAALLGASLLLAGGASAGGIEGPVSLTVGQGSVWVGFGEGKIVRIAPKTRRVSRVVPPSTTGFVGSMAAGFGSVWAARHDGTVLRLDSRTGRVLKTIFVQAESLAAGRGYIWAADSGSALRRIDPRTNKVTGRVRVPGVIWGGVEAGPAGVWVQSAPGGRVLSPAGRRVVWRVHPRTLVLSRPVRRTCDAHLAVAHAVWALDTCRGTVGRLGEKPVDVARTGSAVTVAAGSVWVADGAVVHRVDPRSRTVRVRIAAPGSILSVGAGAVWVLDLGNAVTGWLRQIDTATNRIVGRPIRLSARQ